MRKSFLLLAALLVAQTADSKAQDVCAKSLRDCVSACGPAKTVSDECTATCRSTNDSCEASAAASQAKARANDMFESSREAPRLPALRKTRAPQG